MPSLHDLYCGRLLVKRDIVSVKQIWESFRRLHESYQKGRVVSLIEDLKGVGAITDRHVQKLRAAIQRHQVLVQEKLFAKIVLDRGHVDRDTLKSLVDDQRREQFTRGLGPMLVNRQIITAPLLKELQSEQAVQYAKTVTDGESRLLQSISEFAPPYSGAQEFKVLDTLGLHPDRKPKTEGLWSRQEAERAAARESDRHAAPDRSLYESSDGTFTAAHSSPLASASEPTQPRPEDCPIYGYEIITELGKGAMGVVYKARHIFTDRLTALKVLPLRLAKDSQYLERFKREAIALMRMQHENIVHAYDFGGSEDYYYLALEFIDGETLEEMLERDGKIEQFRAVEIVGGVARGLDFAWSTGVLHRDVKPENIMVSRDGCPKLCDFGIVKLVDSAEPNVTMAGTTVGTPYYISPEQAKGEENLDVRSDIYALGITLWHMLVGQVPFTGKSQGAILVRHILEKVPDPRKYNKSLHPDIAALVMKMTQKKRTARFQTPAEVADAIDELVGRIKAH